MTFSSGQVNNEDRECITIEIIDDNAFESDHTFEVQIASLTPSTAALGSGLAIVVIQDNNGNLNIWMLRYNLILIHSFADALVVMDTSTLTVSEADGSVDICVVSSITGSVESALTVTLTTLDGEASMFKCLLVHFYEVHVANICIPPHSVALLEDYTVPSPFTVVFPAGGTDSTLCLSAVIINDNAFEDDHQFTVEIMDVTSGSLISNPSTTIITIEDDDEGEIKLSHYYLHTMQTTFCSYLPVLITLIKLL